ncbi:tellurite resistance/C4-dicarboxylate transporter family protein [Catenulispora subtropica]|uniref:tellurite resistance/C4-dicarboxylate transporter family protein n=1 Tax=Catenulispora subtropica TaxID=450798 RepID=UPI0031E135B5
MHTRIAGFWAGLPPAGGGIVMATGIESVSLHLAGFEFLSQVLMVLAAAVWLAFVAVFAYRFLRRRSQWMTEASTPPALTGIAGTCVLGTRLALFGWKQVAVALLVIAAVVWPVLLVAVMRHWRRGMPGAVFLVTVATQGLAVLAATLAGLWKQSWLAMVAFLLLVLGLALYLQALYRFDLRQIRTGMGDQWVAGGALAISALAASKLTGFAPWTGAMHAMLRWLTFVVLFFALAWYAVMVWAELRWPRPGYDIRRWATVFPMGMSAAACLSTSVAAGVGWLGPLGRVLMWVAFAVWFATGCGLVAAWGRAVAGDRPEQRARQRVS